jgi:transposase
MPTEISVDKSLEELSNWGQTDPSGLAAYAFALQTEVRRLRDSAAQNSSNSSRPPSTDKPEKPQPKSLREKSGRKPGGQPGHAGKTLEPRQQPDQTVPHRLERCSCGADLSSQPVKEVERRQVFELPPMQLRCIEHQAEVKECPCCKTTLTAAFPPGVNAPVQYGRSVRALAAYFYDVQAGASRRVSQIFADLFGYRLSEATIQSAREQLHQKLQSFEERLSEVLPQQKVLHADETLLRTDQSRHWVHVLCTPLLTLLTMQLGRGRDSILGSGILARFTGWLMHDFLAAYMSLENCVHTFCKSHLMRELVFLFEVHHQAWANDLYDLFLEMLREVKKRKARDAPFTEPELDEWHRRYWKVLHKGRRDNPLTVAQASGKERKQTKEQNLLDRLEGYDHCILAFLDNFDIPFTNNEAERAFRFLKTRMKISGCFRTIAGARRHICIYGYISTVRKNGLNVLDYLRSALQGRPFLPELPKPT